MTKKIAILTGGGDCPGLNPAIRGCVLASEKMGYTCIGFEEGWKGIIENKTIALSGDTVKDLIGLGGTYLGTSRTNPYKQEGGVEAVRKTFEDLGLYALVAMGGEDTLGVANKLYEDFGFPVIGVPKTMDNDLSATDYTFGFDTSVTAAVDALERLRDTAKSHRRIIILEVMGRHAGWVSLFTAIAGGADYVCLPERTVDIGHMIDTLKKAYGKNKYALVVASEAIDLPAADKGEIQARDDFGHILLKGREVGEKLKNLIEKKTSIETRHAVIGHMQRGGRPTLFDRILGTRVGVAAAHFAHKGKFGVMAALKGNEVTSVLLKEAVGKLKTVTPDWLRLADILMF